MKNIKNIVFYNSNTDKGKVKKAIIFYMDGTIEDKSFDEAVDACYQLANEKGLTKDSFKDLLNKKFIHIVSSSEELLKRADDFAATKEEIDKEQDRAYGEELYTSINTEEENYLDEDLEEEEEKQGIFKKTHQKIKKSTPVKKIVATATAVAVAAGLSAGGSSISLKSLEGAMLNSNIPNVYAMDNTDENTNSASTVTTVSSSDANTVKVEEATEVNNENYEDYSYDELLSVTTADKQKMTMTNLGDTILDFNGEFADEHIEEDKDIRAGLKFDEVVALQLAYNDYCDEGLTQIFNGTNITADELGDYYKDASLQLMGAYIIETPTHPVDMSKLIIPQEGKDYYNKIHKLFMEANNATGEEKIEKINAFYKQIREDFSLGDKITASSDMCHLYSSYSSDEELASYKLSVVPMVAAGEVMWQNLNVDLSLENTSIDFLDDIGLYSYTKDKFEHAEEISTKAEEDITNPTYIQYRNAVNKMLKERGIEVINDDYRLLCYLDEYRAKLNYKIENSKCSKLKYSSGTRYTSSSAKKKVCYVNKTTRITNTKTCKCSHNKPSKDCNINNININTNINKNINCNKNINTNTNVNTNTNININNNTNINTNTDEKNKDVCIEIHDVHPTHMDEGKTTETKVNYQDIKTWTDTRTTYEEIHKETPVDESEIPGKEIDQLKDKVDSEISKENEEAKSEAEKSAEETRQEMQQEEDKHEEQVDKEIEDHNEQIDKDIEDANKQIDENNSDQDTSNDTKVNEKDFDGNVDFDENHSDEQGNLDDSVENITKDSTGDMTNEPLPDPNETGESFDAEADIESSEESAEEPVEYETVEEPSYEEPAPVETYEPVAEDESYEPVEYETVEEPSYEEAVDNYVESLDGGSPAEEESYQYTY